MEIWDNRARVRVSQINQSLSEVRYWWVIYDIKIVDRRGRATDQRLRLELEINSPHASNGTEPVGGWSLGACGFAVQACLGSIVYRAGKVHAVVNFTNTSNCY